MFETLRGCSRRTMAWLCDLFGMATPVQSGVHEGVCREFVEKVRHLSLARALLRSGDRCADRQAGSGQNRIPCRRERPQNRCGGKRIARMARRTIGPVSSEMTIAQERDIRAAGACDCFDDADRSCMRPTTRSTAFPHIWPQTEACLACRRGLGIWHSGMNTGRMSSEAAPFGRVKQSGIGREGSRHCLEDYLEMKYLCTGGI